MIQLSKLKKRVGNRTLLRDLNLEVARGEVLVVIGPSGSGKSTLLKCIAGLEPFDGGSVKVGRVRVSSQVSRAETGKDRETLRQLRLGVGLVFQQFNLFPHLTVMENVMEAPLRVLKWPKDRAKRQALSLLEKVQLSRLATRYPRQLSGGEQQRVAIARTLAMNPKCVLFDEPTSALDPERAGEVLRVIHDLAHEGMTLIVVTHRVSFAREVAHRAAMFDGGRFVEVGAPEIVLRYPKEERTRRFLTRILDH